ncbi:MAG TPA: TonB-dependent receptor [Woeseiaceae bacterium]|nr:TonB-dependent receptor [Woeseiaceae bacterium]
MNTTLRDAIRAVTRSSVASAGLLSLLGAGVTAPALAQEDSIEEITVKGIRGSLRQNIDIKRNSNAIVDAITAEDIGEFPDKNVAESLQRVPGVTIQRQFGEGAAVSVRGAGNELTLTTLNGNNVASTGWFVLEPAKRSFNYELLPSEVVGEIEVYKSSQADLAEGGVGGTVEIHTRKPLDLDAMTFRGSIEFTDQSDSDEQDPQASALFSWKDDDERFGVLVSGIAQKRHLQRQGNEAFWEWGAGPVAFEQERNRSAYTAALQFRPSESFEVLVNAIELEMEADNTNYALWLTQGNTSWSGVPVPPECVLNGTPVCGPLGVAFYQMRPREATMKSDVYDLALNYYGDDFEAGFIVGNTTSSGGTDFEMVVDDGLAPPIPDGTYDFTGGGQTWDTGSFDISTYDPGVVVIGTGTAFNKTPKTDEEAYVQGDLTFDVEFGPVSAIKTGLKFTDHNTTSRRFEFDQADGFNPVVSTDGLNTGTISVGSGDMEIVRLDPDQLKDIAKASIVGETEDLGAYSEIDELNYAAYVMAEFGTDRLRGNLGVRYVTTEATSTYYVSGEKTETEADYSEVLPSLNVAYDLSDSLVLRGAAARAMARPQYIDMYVNPNVVGTNDDLPNNQFWIVGNVGLDPFVSDQFDIALEWYFTESSMLSVGYFIKDVKNFVNFTEYHSDASEIPFPLPTTPVNEQAGGWTVQEKTNGKEAQIDGFEVQYQQDFGNGFGAVANVTYSDTDTDEDTFVDGNPYLSDSSETVYNVSGYFENELLQLRLSYNDRSDYMIRETGAYGNRLHDDYSSLDFSGAWFVTDNLTLTLDATNLTEETSHQFGNNTTPTPNSGFTGNFPLFEYEMARTITVGLDFRF